MGAERLTQSRTHVIPVEQAKRTVQSLRTPLPPPKPTTIPGTPQMTPDLQLHPAFNKLKTATRVSNGKVIHPAPQDRIDHLNHFSHRLADVASEDLPEFCE
jgi:hypothetical protein